MHNWHLFPKPWGRAPDRRIGVRRYCSLMENNEWGEGENVIDLTRVNGRDVFIDIHHRSWWHGARVLVVCRKVSATKEADAASHEGLGPDSGTHLRTYIVWFPHLRTPGHVPFGTCICSYVEIILFMNLTCFLTFSFEHLLFCFPSGLGTDNITTPNNFLMNHCPWSPKIHIDWWELLLRARTIFNLISLS